MKLSRIQLQKTQNEQEMTKRPQQEQEQERMKRPGYRPLQ